MSTTASRRRATTPIGPYDRHRRTRRDRARQPTSETKVLLSVEEAADRLDIGRSTFYELIRTDQIRTIHVGRLRKVPVDSLREFVDRQSDMHLEPRDAG